MWHFVGLNTRLICRARSMSVCRLLSCSCSVHPNTAMSSAIDTTPGRSQSPSSIAAWNISWLMLKPNGRRLKQCLPNGVLKVVSNWLLSSRMIDQYPERASSLLKYLALLELWASSSMVGMWCFPCLRTLLRSLGSRHICRDPSAFVTYVRLETQSVGSVTGFITSSSVMRLSSSWILSLSWIGGSMNTWYCIFSHVETVFAWKLS